VDKTDLFDILQRVFSVQDFVREFVTKKEVKREIGKISLIDVIQKLSINKNDGTIIIDGRKGKSSPLMKGFIYLENGNIINATLERFEGEKALFKMLSFDEGYFTFSPLKALSPVRIKKPTEMILMEWAKQVDEYERLKNKLPDMNDHIKLKMKVSMLPAGLRPLTKEVLLLTDFFTKVEDIMDACSYPDFDVLVTLAILARKNIIEIVKGGVDARIDLPPPDVLMKLKERLLGSKGEIVQKGMGKILLLPDKTSLNNFFEQLKRFRQFEPVNNAGRSDLFLGKIGRVHFGENIDIEFILLPSDEDYFPIYSVFTKDVIGGICVLDEKAGIGHLSRSADYLKRLVNIRFVCVVNKTKKEISDEEIIKGGICAEEGIIRLKESGKDLINKIIKKII